MVEELLSIEKYPKINQIYNLYNYQNFKPLKIELQCDEAKYHKDSFILDISRSHIVFERRTNQYRYNTIDTIARVDFYASHTNPEFNWDKAPNDEKLSNLMKEYSEFKFLNQSHIHIFIENYRDKWAFPLEEFDIKSNDEFLNQIYTFCRFCNIIKINFTKGDVLC